MELSLVRNDQPKQFLKYMPVQVSLVYKVHVVIKTPSQMLENTATNQTNPLNFITPYILHVIYSSC